MDAWPRLADGSITLTFRTWAKPQAKAGGRYRVGGMLLEAVAVEQIPIAAITDDEARRAGETDRVALVARLGETAMVWRVELRYLGDDDRVVRRADDALTADELAAIRARLDRMDRSRAWTRSTLQLIERYPGVVSTALARNAGIERPAFKLNVRKLKELGLTESLDIGYRLSPRGEAVLRALG
ncbi:MAG: hypothetical protein ABIR68_14370 [Ilumatobacteraceae bacterium]